MSKKIPAKVEINEDVLTKKRKLTVEDLEIEERRVALEERKVAIEIKRMQNQLELEARRKFVESPLFIIEMCTDALKMFGGKWETRDIVSIQRYVGNYVAQVFQNEGLS